LFTEITPLYIKILITQLEFRKQQQQFKAKEIEREEEERITNPEGEPPRSFFAADQLRAKNEWKQWMDSEMDGIRTEITSELQGLVYSIESSQYAESQYKEKLLDDSVKVLGCYE
jgi:hypothetical protein